MKLLEIEKLRNYGEGCKWSVYIYMYMYILPYKRYLICKIFILCKKHLLHFSIEDFWCYLSQHDWDNQGTLDVRKWHLKSIYFKKADGKDIAKNRELKEVKIFWLMYVIFGSIMLSFQKWVTLPSPPALTKFALKIKNFNLMRNKYYTDKNLGNFSHFFEENLILLYNFFFKKKPFFIILF